MPRGEYMGQPRVLWTSLSVKQEGVCLIVAGEKVILASAGLRCFSEGNGERLTLVALQVILWTEVVPGWEFFVIGPSTTMSDIITSQRIECSQM